MTQDAPSGGLSYADAGVDIDAGDALVQRIKPLVGRTRTAGVLGSLGGFGGLFELPVDRYRQPVMVSGTDGVGTKLRLAIDLAADAPVAGQAPSPGIDTVGIDLVAMCVNDILVCGAQPLWFLDYFATGRLDVERATRVISGIAAGCEQAGIALLGGETAEMPGMYAGDDFDLAGFAVGIAEKSALIDGSRVAAGDVVVGLASSGPHSNGFSLIRKVLDVTGTDPRQVAVDGADTVDGDSGRSLADTLLEPTRIYVRSIARLLDVAEVSALAHITGGGLSDNLPRVLPAGTRACLQTGQWQRPAVFDWLQTHGGISDAEMRRTFNCGIGMTLIISADQLPSALQTLEAAGERAWVIGEIEAHDGGPQVVYAT